MLDPSHAFAPARVGAKRWQGNVRAGLMSRESKNNSRGPTLSFVRKATRCRSEKRESCTAPAWSENHGTHRSFSRGSREIPHLALENGTEVRAVNPEGVRQR